MHEPETVLELLGISKSFGAVIACDEVTLNVRHGEIHALIGPNGAGKSTLINQVVGEMEPDQGDIFLNGQSLAGISVADRVRMGLGRSFQVSSVIPEYTVLQNVMLAVEGGSGRVFSFLKRADKDAELGATAHKYLADVNLEDRAGLLASELSHGERRSLEIAMVLAVKPKVFLMDEPMAGMGPDGSRKLTRFLSDLKQQAPILLVEHDMDAVFELADRISVLVYGRIIATGTVDEIRSNKEVQESYLGEATA